MGAPQATLPTMYTPPSFQGSDDVAAMHDVIRRYNFATLITPEGGGPHVTHLPFLLDAERGPNGTLVAHLARANPHWKAFEGGGDSLVIFVGAHAYISPAWYDNPDTVPTWNYAAVHAHGRPAVIEDDARLREIVLELVAVHEAPPGKGWDPAHYPEAVDRNRHGVVGFEMEMTRLEGKFKFDQKRSAADQEGVINALKSSGDPLARETADIMRRNLRNIEE